MWQTIVLAIAVVSLSCVPANGQSGTTSMSRANIQKVFAANEGAQGSEPVDLKKNFEDMQAARFMAERRAELRRDADKLVALTAELKDNVDKTGPNILSMDVIKKAAEIQKLAKSVEAKMRSCY
jgi:hypothetical protein